MTLDELKPGQRGKILRLSGDGPLVQRLMALGLLEDSEVAMTRRAIGGDPLEVQVMGYALSLRREEARRVEIELLQ
ncbi:MAG: ferrous iron transport protein A [Gammaproteobacteria bacterium]|jgi:ferrous iron transport protein A|nr:ferrous iron transport protein A [Gammaproteobacteria bacterium]